MSYILLNTNRYKDNVLLKTNDSDILVKSQNLLKEEIRPLSNNDIKTILNNGSKETIISIYYDTMYKLYITQYLRNKFKTILSNTRNFKEVEAIKKYKEFESNIGSNLFLYNKVFKDSELFDLVLKYGKKILDLLGNKKLNFVYENSIYYLNKQETKFYFDIDIVDIDKSLFEYLKTNNDFEMLINEMVLNFGLIDYTNYNDDELEQQESIINELILVFILCYVITESIYSLKSKDKKRFNKTYKNINLRVINKEKTLYIDDLEHKLNQMYLILKDRIIKQHLLRVNSYSQEKVMTFEKDTKLVLITNDIVLFSFNYLTNKVINEVNSDFETLREIEQLESYREYKINKVRLNNKSQKEQSNKIDKIKNKTYNELKKEYKRETLKY